VAGPLPERPSGPRRRRRRHLQAARPGHLSAATVKNEINVTPLVDVVLVLLIIFMVVTPMLSRGARVQLPETLHHDQRQDTGDQIVVSVTADGHSFVDTEAKEGEELVRALRKELGKKSSEGGARPVHVKADKALTYGEVRKVLERVHEAGALQVALGSDTRKAEARR
jgi:biopolymer transport protein TolR